MYDALRDVMDNYRPTRARLQGRATNTGSPDQRALLSDLPARIEAHLAYHPESHLFKVKGSIGNGNIARIPWVGVFRTSITKSAENGYYIVLLFAEDMSCCYLSLNQGITAVEKLYTKSFAWKKMREGASEAARRLAPHPESIFGPIKLNSTGDLGRAYEAAAIESFRYSYDALPSDRLFFEHLDHLLNNYTTLVRLFGPDLYSLFSVSEEEFQQVVLEKAALQFNDATLNAPVAIEVTPTSRLGTKGLVRSPAIAAQAVRAANFACEIDATHWTFTSSAKKQRYVEAHHLIPISQQKNFHTSLDVTANIISVCATCHRMLHFGTLQEKKGVLKLLLKQRRQRLFEKSITVKDSEFLQFYTIGNLFED
jgi:5-methylcytosine-specific restriction protein A